MNTSALRTQYYGLQAERLSFSAPFTGTYFFETDTGWMYAWNGASWVVIGGAGSGAPVNASYVVMGLNATLTDERVLTQGNLITVTDGGAGGAATVAVDSTKLTITAGKIDKTGAGTLTLDAAGAYTLTIAATGTAALGAGTLTVSTTNDVTGSAHTHAITSSSNPGPAASILASDASGYLQLTGLGIGIAPTASIPLNIYGTIDGGLQPTIYNDSAGTLAYSQISVTTVGHGVNLITYGNGATGTIFGINKAGAGGFISPIGTPLTGIIFGSRTAIPVVFGYNDIEVVRIVAAGIGILNTIPTQAIGINGDSSRFIQMERHTVADTAGNPLTIRGGGATVGASNKSGGTIQIRGGISTGTGLSRVNLANYVITPTGIVATVTINTPGSGYVAGQILTITGGGANCTCSIDAVDGGGGVTNVTVTAGGTGYSPAASQACTVSAGVGTGCRLNIATLTATAATTDGTATVVLTTTDTQKVGINANPPTYNFHVALPTRFDPLTSNQNINQYMVGTMYWTAAPGVTVYGLYNQMTYGVITPGVTTTNDNIGSATYTVIPGVHVGGMTTITNTYSILIANSGAAGSVSAYNGLTLSTSGSAAFTTVFGALKYINILNPNFGGFVAANQVTNLFGIDIAAFTRGINIWGMRIGAITGGGGGWTAGTNYGLQIGNVTGGTSNYAISTGIGAVSFGDYVKSTGRKRAVVTKTADYTAGVNDEVIICNKATAMTITLPAATGSGQTYAIANVNTGIVTIDGNAAETINGELTQDVDQWAAAQVVDYAAGLWAII